MAANAQQFAGRRVETADEPVARRRIGTLKLGVAVLLMIHAALLAYGAEVQSPTLNEAGHLVAGISYWKFGRFDVYKVNPPLSRMVAALPVLAVGAKTDWGNYYEGPNARPEMSLGEAFVHANGERSMWLITLARWACIPFSLIGGYVVFRWAQELYGAAAGLFALTLWCFCPNILAHGQLITPDMSATALGVAAAWTFWHWLRRPTWWHTLVSGAVLGVAELAKTTLIVFYLVWPLMWLTYRLFEWRSLGLRGWLREIGMLVVRMTIALYVLNLGYGFEGTFTRLGKYHFVSESLGAQNADEIVPFGGGNRFEHSWLAAVPVPLPKNYVQGIDLQKSDFEHYTSKSYLNGRFSDHGWWYYYLYALSIKVPLGTWILLALAATRRFWWRWRSIGTVRGLAHFTMPGEQNAPVPFCPAAGEGQGEETVQGLAHFAMPGEQNAPGPFCPHFRDELILLFPAIVILTFVSSQTGFSEHMRYVLPIFPFFVIWIGRVAVAFTGGQKLMSIVMSAALGWSIVSSLLIYPHSLSYFNELVGGPRGGPAHLIQSNVDWGQDLLFLKSWLAKHPEARPLKLAYFGYVDPRDLRIEFTAPEEFTGSAKEKPVPQKIPPGWYAISVNFLQGLPYSSYNGDGTRTSFSENAFAAFQKQKPIATAGYSIYIYHVER